jgi:hypothetical protein
MEFNYSNFDIIIELSNNCDSFKMKVYDNITNKLYQNIFTNSKLNYKVVHIYKLLIDVLSNENNDIRIIINIENDLIINIFYEHDYCEITQELKLNEIKDKTIRYEIEKINRKVDNLKLSLDEQIINIISNLGLAIPISNKDYIPLNITYLCITCFEIIHNCEDMNDTTLYHVYYPLDNTRLSIHDTNIFNKIESINTCDLSHRITYIPKLKNIRPNTNNNIWTLSLNGIMLGTLNITGCISKIYNIKYENIYKSCEDDTNYIINNIKIPYNGDYNSKYYMNNIKFLQQLEFLTIDCIYIEKFIPEYLPHSIIWLNIIDIDQEIFSGLDHLTNLTFLCLEFRVNHRILLNASIQIKKLLEINPNLEIIIKNYDELKYKDIELIHLVIFKN